MGMPLDMVLACSNHASWNCGPLAFGLPSASNKLSQPDPSDVPSTLKSREKERVSERDREREGERQKWEQVRMSQTGQKRNRNKENKSTSQTYYYLFSAASKATLIVLIVQWSWEVLIHSGSTSWPPPSYLWWDGTNFLSLASPLLTLNQTAPHQSPLSLSVDKNRHAHCGFLNFYHPIPPNDQALNLTFISEDKDHSEKARCIYSRLSLQYSV